MVAVKRRESSRCSVARRLRGRSRRARSSRRCRGSGISAAGHQIGHARVQLPFRFRAGREALRISARCLHRPRGGIRGARAAPSHVRRYYT
jgi:hypothetical protein